MPTTSRRGVAVALLAAIIALVAGVRGEDVLLQCDDVEQLSEVSDAFCTISDLKVSPSQNIRIRSYARADRIKFMKFYDSQLLYVPFRLFDVFANLITLDMSFARIQEVTRNAFAAAANLTYLNLCNNNISQLAASAFVGADKLMRLDLSRNQIAALHAQSFAGLTHLDKLQLSQNRLRTLPAALFAENVFVETIALDGNQLEYIEPAVFERLRHLREILLNDNRLARVHPLTFRSAIQLESVQLASNRLVEFALANQSIGVQLALDHNRLTSVAINATKFVSANNNSISAVHVINAIYLESLQLSHNNISDVRNISALSSLLQLRLSHNPLGPLNVTTFAGLKRLRELQLRATGARRLAFGMFSKQPSLESLDLAYNNLSALNLDMFVPYLANVRQLYVDGNNLSAVDGTHTWAQAFPQLQKLGISQNRFNCSYLHRLLIPPSLPASVSLHIEPEARDAEGSHIRDVGCVSGAGESLQHAERELQSMAELQRLMQASLDTLRAHEQRLQLYLLLLKIAALLLGGALVAVLALREWRRRQQPASAYFSRRIGVGSISFHSSSNLNSTA